MASVKFGVAAVLVVATAVEAHGAEPAPTIADVTKAWKARQGEAKTFHVEWVATVKMKAGSSPFPADRNNPGPHPPEDTEYTSACSFASEGDKAAGAVEEAIYFPMQKTWRPSAESIRFDGKASMRINPLYRPGWARVNIDTGDDPLGSGLQSTTNQPLMLVYRPLGGGAFSVLDFELFKVSDREEKIRGACRL